MGRRRSCVIPLIVSHSVGSIMAANPPKRPKLRTSCDQCGSAKVKCDRGQPDCARCVSHGRTCVYGVSRKMGKPPRVKLRYPSPSRSPGGAAGGGGGGGVRKIERSLGVAESAFDRPPAGVADAMAAWDAMDESAAGIDLDALGGFFNDLNGQFSPHSPSFNLGEWAYTDQFSHHLSPCPPLGTFPTPESTEWGSYPSTEASTAQATAHQSPSDASPRSERIAIGFSGHDCPRAAYDILRNLSFPNHANHSASPLTSTPAPTSLHMGIQVPLDHVLRLNSEASERLGPLLSCPCARSPNLAFLYASIISKILLWYQQAAGYTHSASWAHPAPEYPSGSEHMSGPYTTGMAVAPAKMAIGSFNVDDLRIQTALKIQLLSGEMGRASRLIDQFTSLSAESLDESHSGSVDRLYQSLHSWLRGEHLRIANMMRLKLRELNP
ncbi:hypothetical protein EDB81DRAFT_814427 [Dactylonectria macrodidyma]|uniref:Zn(2)-C6 fungal-type domain-containing protein n=1 Tax=Dactylonectria macrodidyma TaxID=307937 RepID=A0A9P9DJY1_9HYPO|nr:hypothetical protein EDB81DRAFT_814427 [Dactylonectria macrodidyma]